MSSVDTNFILSINKLPGLSTKDLISGFIKNNIKCISITTPNIVKSIILFYYYKLTKYFYPEKEIQYNPYYCKTHEVHKSDNLQQIIQRKSWNNDKIKIHDGEYDLNCFYRNTHVIGSGNNVILNCSDTSIIIPRNVFIENVTINIDDGPGFVLGGSSRLWLNECIINFVSRPIWTQEGANLYILNCSFNGRKDSDNIESALRISPWSENTFILNSTFTHCGGGDYLAVDPNLSGNYPCIQIIGMKSGLEADKPITSNVVCIDNTFIDNNSCLIAKEKMVQSIKQQEINIKFGLSTGRENDWFDHFQQNKDCFLRNNIVNEKNTKYVKEQINDANILYSQIVYQKCHFI